MYKELDNKQFDYIVIGTSMCESILSSYLAKSGKKIIQFDISKFYGGDCKNFTFRDLDHCIIYFYFFLKINHV
jgi:RAB protein geranylgeranyltransferase component A